MDNGVFEEIKSIINDIYDSCDNKYIKSTCKNILLLKVDELESGEMTKDEYNSYCDKIITRDLRNIKNVVPTPDKSIIEKIEELENLIDYIKK